MTANFADQAVLVAGGAGGLGTAVTLAFLQAGAVTYITAREGEALQKLRQAAGPGAGRLQARQVDVSDEAATAQYVQEIAARHQRLDILVNTVGGYRGGRKLWQSDAGEYDLMLAQNLRSGYVLARAAAPVMLARGQGVIVNVASRAALEPGPGAAMYAASKAAALALMQSLAAELNGSGVRVTSILPRIFDTPANRRAMPEADFSQWPQPAEIAQVILFLCGEDARLLHGAAVPV